ncbi:MAG: histidine phosphatase family protein [Pseudomonadales bacterium]
MASILLLRHGQILANKQGRWHGSTDSALTWRGRRQVRRTARHLEIREPAITAIYTSPLQRCLNTAESIGKRLGIEVEVREDLREYAIGEWEDLSFRELAERHDFVNKAASDPEFAPPDGESLSQVAQRIVPVVHAINDSHAAQGHGAAMAIPLAAIIDNDPVVWTSYHLTNCSLTELVLSPSPYVNFFNSTQHL